MPRSRNSTLAALALVVALLGCPTQEKPTIGQIVEAQSLGSMYLDQNKLPEAEQAYKRLVKLAPEDVDARVQLAIVYLRLDRPDDAKKQIDAALDRDTASVDAHLILASINEREGHRDQAIADLTRLSRMQPPDPRALYALVELARTDPDSNRGAAAERDALSRLVAQAPSSVPARIALARALATTGNADSALGQLEALRQLPPAMPKETKPSFDEAMRALRANDRPRALRALATLQQFLETTVPFQTALNELRGPQIMPTGQPGVTLPRPEAIRERMQRDTGAPPVSFVDATADLLPGGDTSATGGGAVAAGDIDGDGTPEVFVAGSGGKAMLLHRSPMSGQWSDVAQSAGIAVSTVIVAAFGDVNNDGWLDLFVVSNGAAHLFRNDGKGHFSDDAAHAGLTSATGTVARFADLDHDGDLDLLLASGAGPLFYRNNGDGTFADVTMPSGLRMQTPASDVVFGDVDGDGLLDVLVSSSSGVRLFRNDRERRLDDFTAASGFAGTTGGAIALADYDNDGNLDLAVSSPAGVMLFRGNGTGAFARDTRSDRATGSAARAPRQSRFADFDNDGWLDLVLVDSARVSVLRNVAGKFERWPGDVPAVRPSANATIATADLDNDRDVDLLVSTPSGARFLQNRGGNQNLAVQIALKGLTTGSGKNNVFGIGSRIELRAGDLYEMRVVTDQTTLIGIGHHAKADAIRVEWPNGVPQTLYYPGSDQDVLENQVLKSSCAFVYAWNGTSYAFVTDAMWRSALGMPVGIGGGSAGSATVFAPAPASREYVKLPRNSLVARNGRYRLQFTEELWETSYTDAVELVAVDHPVSTEVAVDERFLPPTPNIRLDLRRMQRVRPPVAVTDDRGTDQLPAVRDADFRFATGFDAGPYQGIMTSHTLTIDLGDVRGNELLQLRGWVFPTDASINVAMSQQRGAHAVASQWPVLEAESASGWRRIDDLSIPSGKNKVIVVDLAGKLRAGEHRVRIRTNLAVYWDQISIADPDSADVRINNLGPVAGDLHYRGFSRMYRKGGRYGPHWFDYDSVTHESPWRPIAGAFTRYGDVNELVQSADDRYIVMAPGDEATIEFDAAALPPLPTGWVRDFLVYSVGWIKDADFNTAFGGTAEPLPFHGMTRYPYGAAEHYPADADHQRYLRTYNTRSMDMNLSLRNQRRTADSSSLRSSE